MSETLRLGTTNRRLDVLAVEQGVEKECPLRPGLTVTILPAGVWNPRFQQALQARIERMAEAQAKNGDGKKPPAERNQDPEFVASALVLKMDGLYAADGSKVEYTLARGVSVLSDPANGDVMAWIVHEAQDYDRYYTGSVEADAKNSSTGSNGKQVGAGSSKKTRS